MWSIERRRFQWSWTTPNPVFKVMLFFDAEYDEYDSSNHLLHVLLPEHTNYPYHLRLRTHSFKLSAQHDNRNFIDRMLFRQAYSVSVWLLSWLYFIHLTAVPVLFLLYATVFFIFLHIYLQLRFVICILYNKWMNNTFVSQIYYYLSYDVVLW